MKCPNCGSEISSKKFCTKCGAPLETVIVGAKEHAKTKNNSIPVSNKGEKKPVSGADNTRFIRIGLIVVSLFSVFSAIVSNGTIGCLIYDLNEAMFYFAYYLRDLGGDYVMPLILVCIAVMAWKTNGNLQENKCIWLCIVLIVDRYLGYFIWELWLPVMYLNGVVGIVVLIICAKNNINKMIFKTN